MIRLRWTPHGIMYEIEAPTEAEIVELLVGRLAR